MPKSPRKSNRARRRKRRAYALAGGNAGQRHGSHDGNRWLTPPEVVEAIRFAFGGAIDLDPATEPNNPTGALSFYTVADNGLDQEWGECRILLNPPYSTIEEWIKRAIEAEKLGAQIYLIAPVRTDAAYHHQVMQAATDVLFVRGRLRFARPDGIPAGTASFATMIVGLGTSVRRLSLPGTVVVPTHWSSEAA